jgi:bla regulator protein BlaR1
MDKGRNRMIKELKNINHKISTKTILSCIIATTMVLTNFVIAKGIDSNSITTTNFSNTQNTKDQHEFIIDAPVKFYDDIKKAERVADFKFKVPDYFPKGYQVECFEFRKLSKKDNGLGIIFENKNGFFSFLISEQDPADSLKVIESEKSKAIENSKVESVKKPMKLGEINGLNVTVTTILPARQIGQSYSKESKTVNNYFAWKDQGLWYSIEYNSKSNSEEINNDSVTLSNDDIKSIAKSIKYPEEIKSINYCVQKDVSAGNPAVNIYDKEDIEKTKSILGFNPKFPLKINEDINITSSIIGITDIEKNKISYELNNFYSNKNGSITFCQSKNSSIYEDIKENGYISKGNNEGEQVQAGKLMINNNEVFKYSSKGIASQVNYIWKENDIYYGVVFFINIENSDEIVKEFINSKPLE